jgi:hypothetical protein
MPRALLLPIFLAIAVPSALAETLSPGKPAGIQPAQHINYKQGFLAASIIAVALVYALPSSSATSTATSTVTTS